MFQALKLGIIREMPSAERQRFSQELALYNIGKTNQRVVCLAKRKSG